MSSFAKRTVYMGCVSCFFLFLASQNVAAEEDGEVLEQYMKTRHTTLANGDPRFKNHLHFNRFGAHVDTNENGSVGPDRWLPHGIYEYDADAVGNPWSAVPSEAVKAAAGNPSCSQYSSDTADYLYQTDLNTWDFTDATPSVDGTLKVHDGADFTI